MMVLVRSMQQKCDLYALELLMDDWKGAAVWGVLLAFFELFCFWVKKIKNIVRWFVDTTSAYFRREIWRHVVHRTTEKILSYRGLPSRGSLRLP
jgi:hypothetical protein